MMCRTIPMRRAVTLMQQGWVLMVNYGPHFMTERTRAWIEPGRGVKVKRDDPVRQHLTGHTYEALVRHRWVEQRNTKNLPVWHSRYLLTRLGRKALGT